MRTWAEIFSFDTMFSSPAQYFSPLDAPFAYLGLESLDTAHAAVMGKLKVGPLDQKPDLSLVSPSSITNDIAA